MKKYFFVPFLILALFGSCKKYEDGPVFSIHTKTHRLTGSWGIHYVSEDGVDKTSDYQNARQGYLLVFTAEGDYTITYTINGIFNYSETGTWNFSRDKSTLILTKTSSNTATEWTILKLKNKEFWMKYTDYSSTPNKEVEWHFNSLSK
ncbi:MAG TPA: lipocalin family protein [Bacteroidia bacterium]|nr:lipocalin family protein [Bacteroidia bacterium]